MSRSIDVVIAPGPTATRVLVTAGPPQPLLTAHLAPTPHHPRALPWLLEALAFWEGATVRGVLAVDDTAATCGTTLFRDVFADSDTPLYRLDWVPLARPRRAPRPAAGFGDLHALLRAGGAR